MDVRRIRTLFQIPHPRRNRYTPVYSPRKCGDGMTYALMGSGYSTPKVSTVTFFMT